MLSELTLMYSAVNLKITQNKTEQPIITLAYNSAINVTKEENIA